MEQKQLPELPDQQKAEENVIADYYDGMKQLEMQGHETSIRKARNTLFVAAVLVFIGEMYSISQLPDGISPLAITIVLIESGIFVALAFWTKKRPYSAILTGIILIFLYWGLSVYASPENIFRGVLARIVMIVYLVRATGDAKKWEELKKRN